jgi:hypothetical protein
MSSHSKTMANHLLSCDLQTRDTKQRIEAHKEKYSDSTTKSPTRQRILPPIPHMTDPGLPSGSSGLSSIPTPIPQLHVPDHPLRYQPYPMEALRYRESFEPDMPPSATSSFDSLHPSESASQVSYQGPSSRPSSRLGRRRSSLFPSNVPGELMVPVWSAARTRLFEHRILRLTASAGFPLSWVENPEFQAIREEFIPGSPHISRKVLTKRILREVVTEFREGVKQRVAGKEATMQSDGWTGINNHHLVAFMITTNKKVIVLQTILYMPA